MLCVCVCKGCGGCARVWEYECFVMQVYVCVLFASCVVMVACISWLHSCLCV